MIHKLVTLTGPTQLRLRALGRIGELWATNASDTQLQHAWELRKVYIGIIDCLLNFMELNYIMTSQRVSGPSRALGLFMQP